MIKIILFNFLIISLNLLSQVETLVLEKDKNSITYPHFGDIEKGKISINYWKNNNVIELNENYKVYSYSISFPFGINTIEYNIVSDSIPQNVLNQIKDGCLNEEVFISNIKAMDKNGKLYLFPSMSLIPYVDE